MDEFERDEQVVSVHTYRCTAWDSNRLLFIKNGTVCTPPVVHCVLYVYIYIARGFLQTSVVSEMTIVSSLIVTVPNHKKL